MARPGFSIVELVVVLMVVSAVAYVAVPNVEITRFRMDAAVRGSMTALVSAQRLAVKRQHDVVVAFDTANRRLLIHQDRNNDGVANEGEPVRQVVLAEAVVYGLGHAPALGAATETLTFTETYDGLPALRFIRNGSASEEGTFYLTSVRGGESVGFAKDTRAVRVDRPTGRVTWYRYAPPNWVEGF